MPPKLSKGALLTTAEAAALLRVSPATLKRWTESGLVPSERTRGGHRRLRREDLSAIAEPRVQVEDPVRRGADLVVGSADSLGLSSWLLQARRELGSWWTFAPSLQSINMELYRRRTVGEMGGVELEAALDRLRTALLRLVETLVPQDGPTLLVASVPGDPFLVAPAFLQVAAPESGWRTEWAGHPEVVDLSLALEHRPPQAVAVFSSVGASPDTVMHYAPQLEAMARASGIPVAVVGIGEWPLTSGAVTRRARVADLQPWLEELRALSPAQVRATALASTPAAEKAGAAPDQLRWDPRLRLGDPTVDLQHALLFRHVDRFLAATRLGEGDARSRDLLRFIEDYAQVHFRFEENLMRTSRYPQLAEHLFQHEEFTRRVAELKGDLKASPTPELLNTLARFVASWLRDHVSGSDQRLGHHLKNARAN